MQTIYHAANLIDAQLVVDLLAASHIPAHVQGGFLSGGIGELPAGEMVRVWVADDEAERARRLIANSLLELDPGDLRPQVPPTLAQSWRRCWLALGCAGADEQLRDRLLEAWSEPQRSYHTLQHLQECVAHLLPHLSLAGQPGEVELALWFHDAIYQPRAQDNEARSAQWAVDEMHAAGLPQETAARVHALVLATAHEAQPASDDQRLLVDVDLAILGAAPSRFEEYERQVREEFAWVPGWVFRRRRRELLAGFLARPRLFHTPPFHDAFEAPARDNLRRSIARLRPWWRFGGR